MAKSKVIAMIILLTASLITLLPNIVAYAQNESNQATQPGQNAGEDETAQPETVTTTTGGAEDKIRCSNGSLVASSSECSSSDECPSEPSENVTLQCTPASQQNNRNNNTNVTNASSVNEVGNTSQIQTENLSAIMN
jgi:hypothetical protein